MLSGHAIDNDIDQSVTNLDTQDAGPEGAPSADCAVGWGSNKLSISFRHIAPRRRAFVDRYDFRKGQFRTTHRLTTILLLPTRCRQSRHRRARWQRSTRVFGALSRPRIHSLFAAGRDTHPGKLGNCIVFSGMRPAPRCHEAISSSAHVPDALVSAK
jgi:hypothetical protein